MRDLLRSDRGSTALEAAIVAPVLVVLIGVLTFAGRVALAQQAVDAASMDAARAASIARTRSAAEGDARSSASSTLSNRNLRCSSTSVNADTSGFSAPVGTLASVNVTVRCTVSMSDLLVPGLPGSRTLSAHMASPIDTYRERGN